MDPIKQALERARQAQEASSGTDETQGDPSPSDAKISAQAASADNQTLAADKAAPETSRSSVPPVPPPPASNTKGNAKGADALQAALQNQRAAEGSAQSSSRRGAKGGNREGDDQQIDRTRTPVVQLDPFHLVQSRVTAFEAEDELTAPFDMLRTRVMQAMSVQGWRTLGVLSADPGEGKTMTAINLAFSISKLPNQTALLLDLDFRQPGLLATLGHYPEYCIDDWLKGACEFPQALFSPMTSRLAVAGVRAPIANPAETLSATRVTRLIDELRSRYSDRIIVVDMPSVLVSDDALTLIPRIDAFLMVVAAGQTTGARARECMQLLPVDRVVGSILNKSIR